MGKPPLPLVKFLLFPYDNIEPKVRKVRRISYEHNEKY